MKSPPAQPAPTTASLAQARAAQSVQLVLLALFGLSALHVAGLHAFYAQLPGENTIGEAGKVYFAQRFAGGEGLFARAASPPHYPSFHGPLFHFLFGVAGKLLGLSQDGYVVLGRGASITLVLATAALVAWLARRLGAGRPMQALAPLVFLSSFSIHFVSSSFRPDPWMLFLGVTCCVVVVAGRWRWWAWGLVVALPVASFFIKPTGFAAAGGVFVALLALGRWKAALACGAASWALLGAAVGGLQLASGGEYLASLSDGVGVPYSFSTMWASLGGAENLAVLAAPALLAPVLLRGEAGATRAARVVLAFWGCSLAVNLAAGGRIGSYHYYSLEPFALGSVALAAGIGKLLHDGEPKRPRLLIAASATVALALLLAPSLAGAVRKPLPGRTVLAVHELLDSEREAILKLAGERGIVPFSDDPSLNIQLGSPPTLYVRQQEQLEAGGRLPQGSLVESIARAEHALVVLIEPRLPYQPYLTARGIPGFDEALARAYQPVEDPFYFYALFRPARPLEPRSP